jgi:hypothetical protein
LAEWLLRSSRKAVGVIPWGFESLTLRTMVLFKKNEPKEVEYTSKDLVQKVEQLQEKIGHMEEEIASLQKSLRNTFTNIGIVRFNPFKEIGGDQSFCIALLNTHQNGVIITSYYGRDLNRVYAKEIQGGTSKHELSKEEKEAIRQAIS